MDKNPLREGNAYVRQREDPLEVTRPTQAEELLLLQSPPAAHDGKASPDTLW